VKIKLTIDPNNQWFVRVNVTIGTKNTPVTFKVDTGCNSLVLSHDTLKKLGVSTDAANLGKLSNKMGRLASGEKHIFKVLGAVSLYSAGSLPAHICNAEAICHETRETRDLLGTEVLKRFADVHFGLSGNTYMELMK
jgi:predicted aspartyl protease